MAPTTLRDRVRAATAVKPPPRAVRLVETVGEGTVEELHAAERADGGETADSILEWLDQYADHFTAALPSHLTKDTFLAAARASLPDLVRCTPASLLQAFLTCARFGLPADGVHAVVKAEGSTAVFVPMYRGYVKLMCQTGDIDTVHVGLIHQHEKWSLTPSAPFPHDFVHESRPDLPEDERGPAILAYAFCRTKSGARSQVVVLSRQEAEAIRDEYSVGYRRAEESGRKDSFWHRKFDRMWEKSALLRLPRTVPTSTEVHQLVKADQAGEAGQVQVIHAPDNARLRAEAEEAHERAEDAQEPEETRPRPQPQARPLLRKRSQPKRSTRAARKGARR